jgi:hypothetical protein
MLLCSYCHALVLCGMMIVSILFRPEYEDDANDQPKRTLHCYGYALAHDGYDDAVAHGWCCVTIVPASYTQTQP